MLENIYTTKMSASKKQLQNRFTKIRSSSGRISKIMSFIMAIFVAVTFVCATVVMAALNNEEWEKEPITLYSGGEIITLENKPFIQDNMTYFPLRETFEKLGVFEVKANSVEWADGIVYVTASEAEESAPVYYTIEIGRAWIGVSHRSRQEQNEMAVLVLKTELSAPALLVEDITYVPYTFIDYMLNRGLDIKNKPSVFDFMFTVNSEEQTAFLSQGFAWPCDGHTSNSFGKRVHPITGEIKKHNGIDIAAPEGAEVRSAIYGTVAEVDFDTEKGYYVIIERENVQTVYTGLMPDVKVTEGDEVISGQIIGSVGKTGMSTGAHLHFEVLINGEYYNPELIG